MRMRAQLPALRDHAGVGASAMSKGGARDASAKRVGRGEAAEETAVIILVHALVNP